MIKTKKKNLLNNNWKKMNLIRNKIYFNLNIKMIYKMKKKNKFNQKIYKNYQYNLMI